MSRQGDCQIQRDYQKQGDTERLPEKTLRNFCRCFSKFASETSSWKSAEKLYEFPKQFEFSEF